MKISRNLFIASLSCLVIFTSSAMRTVRAQSFSGAPALPVIPGGIYNITNYGAIGDGVATNTAAIQAAINAASAAGGGIVEVPAGSYLSGPVRLASGINLRVERGAVLRMLPLDKYPGGTVDPENFISGAGLHDVAISGSGMIDGQLRQTGR